MAYTAQFKNTGNTGGGPRVVFGNDNDPNKYMTIGAYDNINNIDTTNRPLMIHGLPDSSTAPDNADLRSIVIDKNTGQLYIL